MPYKDKEKQREYQREWSRSKFSGDEKSQERRERKKSWSDRNREYVKQYQRLWSLTEKGKASKEKEREYRKGIVAWFRELKNGLTCSRCPENDPICLEFHHRDPTTKRFIISKMPRSRASPKMILEEIDKCEVLCANCHRKAHRKKSGG